MNGKRLDKNVSEIFVSCLGMSIFVKRRKNILGFFIFIVIFLLNFWFKIEIFLMIGFYNIN